MSLLQRFVLQSNTFFEVKRSLILLNLIDIVIKGKDVFNLK